jgi:hypothetical protein
MLRVKNPPLVPTTWLMVTLMVVDPPSCEAHMIVVSDVHAVDEHTAASDAVGLGSQIPKFMPLKVKLVPLPKLAGAFAAAEPIVSTGAAVATPSAAALGPTLIGPHTVFAGAEKGKERTVVRQPAPQRANQRCRATDAGDDRGLCTHSRWKHAFDRRCRDPDARGALRRADGRRGRCAGRAEV